MSLRLEGYVALPAHATESGGSAARARPGGFDHAAVHHPSSRLYVAHTSNDCVDVVDCASDRFLGSIPGLPGAAGVLVSDERGLVFTANRAEGTVSLVAVDGGAEVGKLRVGIRPNGLAFDESRGLLLVANVGDPRERNGATVSVVDVDRKAVTGTAVLPGRPRWAVYEERSTTFFLNISDPPLIVGIDPRDPQRFVESHKIPAAGPHGLDLEPRRRRLFCACDGGKLVTVRLDSEETRVVGDLSGPPDVVFFNAARRCVYVAVGDPGVIDVFDAERLERLGTVPTEKGAHTIALDRVRNKVYAFLPATHRAAVFRDD